MRVELREGDDRDGDDPAQRFAPLDRESGGHRDEGDEEEHRAGEPHDLGSRGRQQTEGDGQHGERGQILELKMSVGGAIERFGVARPRGRLPIHLEVRHLGRRLVDEHPDCERHQQARQRQPASRQRASEQDLTQFTVVDLVQLPAVFNCVPGRRVTSRRHFDGGTPSAVGTTRHGRRGRCGRARRSTQGWPRAGQRGPVRRETSRSARDPRPCAYSTRCRTPTTGFVYRSAAGATPALCAAFSNVSCPV